MINPNYQILWLLFVTIGKIQDMMTENDYKNTNAKTGLTGKRRPRQETEKRGWP